LAKHLTDAGRPVVILSRSTPTVMPSGCSHVAWDGRSLGEWASALDGASGLVNLAGRTVDCIKTPLHIDQILRSRVDSTRALGEALRRVERPPPVWVQMSTAHIYGDSELPCDESSALGLGLAPDVGRAWEHAFDEARPEHVRGVVLRTGFVIGRGGGALKRLSLVARLGLGGTVGTGRQGMSWIHEHDMNRLFERGLDNATMTGVYNSTGPNPVAQRVLMRSLRKAMGIPIGLPAFAWMVNLGAPLVLRTDPELALYGRYIRPRRLIKEGFVFEFPDLDPAMTDLLGKGAGSR
jgi:uncharacterized protein (TIGR01777 family)